jgi:hypothetical protein
MFFGLFVIKPRSRSNWWKSFFVKRLTSQSIKATMARRKSHGPVTNGRGWGGGWEDRCLVPAWPDWAKFRHKKSLPRYYKHTNYIFCHKNACVRMLVQECLCKNACARMLVQECLCKNACARMLVQECLCKNVCARMLVQECLCKNAKGYCY